MKNRDSGHPNIVLFMGACTTADTIYIVTEYCSNRSIYEQFFKTEIINRISFSDKIKWAMEIAAGLTKLHSCGIVHHDLKLENILLDNNNVAKICGEYYIYLIFKTKRYFIADILSRYLQRYFIKIFYCRYFIKDILLRKKIFKDILISF